MDPGDVLRDEDGRDDRDLRALFAREPAHFAEQPFVNELARRVAGERRRRAIVTRAAIGVSVATLIAAAPWLISASAFFSAQLAALFSSSAGALESPVAYALGIAVVVAAAVLRRRPLG